MTVACLWAALFNNLLLPWSSRDWALEQISGALTAAAHILDDTCQLQFKAAEAAVLTGSSGSSSKSDLPGALLQQEGALQKRLIEPVVAVQTGGWGPVEDSMHVLPAAVHVVATMATMLIYGTSEAGW